MTNDAPGGDTTVIEPSRGWAAVLPRFGELLRYRELLFFLVWRDLKVRYKQTAFGIAWALIQPLVATLVLWVFFGKLAGVSSEGVPYALFAYSGLLAWQLFSNALTGAANSLINNQALVKKVYFPRLLLPAAAAGEGVVDFVIGLAVLVVLMAFAGVTPTVNLFYLPLFVLLSVLAALAAGLWLGALNALYRDVRYTLPFLLQIGFFATPIAYSTSAVDARFRPLLGLNPLVGAVEGVRWSLFGTRFSLGMEVWVSVAVVLVTLVGGLLFFRRMERNFADVL